MRDWHYGEHGGNGLGFVACAMMVILFVLLAIWVVRQLTGSSDHAHAGNAPSPLEVLDQRFARGEIPLEDYTRDREVLKKALHEK